MTIKKSRRLKINILITQYIKLRNDACIQDKYDNIPENIIFVLVWCFNFCNVISFIELKNIVSVCLGLLH